MKKIVCHAVAFCICAIPLLSNAQSQSKGGLPSEARRDGKASPYIEGGRKNENSEPYITGGRSDDRFTPYIQGGNQSTRADLNDANNTKPTKGKPAHKKTTPKPAD